MDVKFHPAISAIKSGDVNQLHKLIDADPSLATSRSTRSHPTLLQCVTLDTKGQPNSVALAKVLIAAGAELNEPFGAAASIDNRPVAELLLEHGAVVDGTGGWSPLEEALYWDSREVMDLLLARGAKIQNLRTAAGLGRMDLLPNYFDENDKLKPEAGTINWPWGDLDAIANSCHSATTKQSLSERVSAWQQDQQGIVNNAFVYACMHGHIEAAAFLLKKGAELNAIPGGFDFAGTGLHYAALNGHRAMVEFLLERGADRKILDTKVNSTAAGWAEHGGHLELRDLLG
ncbi:MAG TPA: ankyrin repeat domain-containing protein [Pyrinomonadaceae bacterium]